MMRRNLIILLFLLIAFPVFAAQTTVNTSSDSFQTAWDRQQAMNTELYTADTTFESLLVNSAGLRGALSDESGSGLSIFGTNPVFSESIDIGTASTTQGYIEMYTNGSAFKFSFLPGANTEDHSIRFPAAYPTSAGSVGSFATNGTMTYVAPTGTGFAVFNDNPDILEPAILFEVRNVSGGTLAIGKWIYATGAVGNRVTVALADNTAYSTSHVFGITQAEILNNANGFVVVGGAYTGNTTAFNDGDELYLGTSGDAVTSNPGGTAERVSLGDVKYDNVTLGIIAVDIDHPTVLPNGVNLTEFVDQTAWRLFYSDTAGDVTELALGADNTYLMSNGAALAPTFETVAGSGDVTAAAVMTDNTLVKADGGAKGVQDSGITIDDSDNVSGIGSLSAGASSFTSVTITPSATPTLTLSDSDLLGADEEAAKLFAQATTVTDGAEVTDVTLTYMDAGTPTNAFVVDGSDNQLEMAIPTTLQAGDIVLAELATDSVDYTKTTGSFKSLTPVTGTAAGFAAGFTGANLYGGTYIVNVTGTVQLPAMLVDMNFTIITLGAIAVIIDTNVADGYLLDGTTGVEGANLTNLSTAGDIAVMQYYTADDWLITTNGWTAE